MTFANIDLYLPLAGFLCSFVLLLYSVASYRESLAQTAPAADLSEAVLEESEQVVGEITAEIAAFKLKISQMRGMVDMRKNLHEKQIGEIITGINGIVGRLESADPQKVAALQPHIAKLVSELQELRSPQAAERK